MADQIGAPFDPLLAVVVQRSLPVSCLPADCPQRLDVGPRVEVVVGLAQLLHQHVDQLGAPHFKENQKESFY